MLTYGPAAVLGDVLAGVRGVDEAYVYGSWAARYAGEPGPPPRDVDVLVVGDADEDDAFDAARAAEQRLGREVNIHRVPAKSWRAPGRDPFLASVRSRPLFSIELPKDRVPVRGRRAGSAEGTGDCGGRGEGARSDEPVLGRSPRAASACRKTHIIDVGLTL